VKVKAQEDFLEVVKSLTLVFGCVGIEAWTVGFRAGSMSCENFTLHLNIAIVVVTASSAAFNYPWQKNQ